MDVIELAEKAEKTSKSAKILEKIGDIKNIADVAEDFAQDTQNVERYVNEIESGTTTISSADRIKIDAWDYTPSDELYSKYKNVFDVILQVGFYRRTYIKKSNG